MKIYTLGLMLLMSAGSFAQKSVTIPYVEGITIDGERDNVYSEPNSISNCIDLVAENQNTCGFNTPATGCNNTATWSAAYDNEYLYLFFKVVDATISTPAMTKDFHTSDGVEVFLSMENDRRTGCTQDPPVTVAWNNGQWYNISTLQLTFVATDALDSYGSPQGAKPAVEGRKFLATSDGYNFEVKLKFSELDFNSQPGIMPTEGRIITADFGINDTDVQGYPRSAQSMWNACCADRNWTSAENFGTITLGPKTTASIDINNLVSSLVLFPNPTNLDKVSLRLDARFSEEVNISVINSLSENMISKNVSLYAGKNDVELSTQGMANGVYYVLVSNGKSNKTQKLIITK